MIFQKVKHYYRIRIFDFLFLTRDAIKYMPSRCLDGSGRHYYVQSRPVTSRAVFSFLPDHLVWAGKTLAAVLHFCSNLHHDAKGCRHGWPFRLQRESPEKGLYLHWVHPHHRSGLYQDYDYICGTCFITSKDSLSENRRLYAC